MCEISIERKAPVAYDHSCCITADKFLKTFRGRRENGIYFPVEFAKQLYQCYGGARLVVEVNSFYFFKRHSAVQFYRLHPFIAAQAIVADDIMFFQQRNYSYRDQPYIHLVLQYFLGAHRGYVEMQFYFIRQSRLRDTILKRKCIGII